MLQRPRGFPQRPVHNSLVEKDSNPREVSQDTLEKTSSHLQSGFTVALSKMFQQ